MQQPQMNCQQCYQLYQIDEVQPMCRTSEGCPIGEALAADPVVNTIAGEYLLAKKLHVINKLDAMFIETMQELGLWDEKELLIELEAVFHGEYARQRESAARAVKADRGGYSGNRGRGGLQTF